VAAPSLQPCPSSLSPESDNVIWDILVLMGRWISDNGCWIFFKKSTWHDICSWLLQAVLPVPALSRLG
jgi:hypothetical protein